MRWFLPLFCAALTALFPGCASRSQPHPIAGCEGPKSLPKGWQASFKAPCIDRQGKLAGGSQIMHLVAHEGSLYAGSGYWMDRRNIWYGGTDPSQGWGQVLKLAGPKDAWTVDLDLGPKHLRTELLKSIRFTVDAQGTALATPQSLLIAATYDGAGDAVNVFVRSDEESRWIRTSVIRGQTGVKGEDNSVRAAAVYRDRVTGEEKLYLSVGILGVYTAQFDPSAPGHLRWDRQPEPGTQTGTRILSIVPANDSLFISEGTRVLRRIDGPQPRYVTVADLSDERHSATDRKTFQAIGGIRGLSAIDGPVSGRQSLIFVWHPGKLSPACVMRLDPQTEDRYARHTETCLARLVSKHLDGASIPFVLAAYNGFEAIRDPVTQTQHHVIGLEAFIAAAPGTAAHALIEPRQHKPSGGFYGGALYAVRDDDGRWRVGEVNGRHQAAMPGLVSIYTFSSAPFGDTQRPLIYMGGYDPNDLPASDTAWIYSTTLTNLLSNSKLQ